MKLPEELTLRDYFAGQAMTGIIDSADKLPMGSVECDALELVAKACYRLADEMLKERNKENDH